MKKKCLRTTYELIRGNAEDEHEGNCSGVTRSTCSRKSSYYFDGFLLDDNDLDRGCPLMPTVNYERALNYTPTYGGAFSRQLVSLFVLPLRTMLKDGTTKIPNVFSIFNKSTNIFMFPICCLGDIYFLFLSVLQANPARNTHPRRSVRAYVLPRK